jgi:GxxExxY protein
MAEKEYPHRNLTEAIIGCAYDVFTVLGHGFLEKVYENALTLKIKSKGLKVKQQEPINVIFEGHVVGEYFADLLIEDAVIIELKAVSDLAKIHEAQLVNYLKAIGIKVGLLINFGETISIKRRVF